MGPEAVDGHAAAAKFVQNVRHVLRILSCQHVSGLNVVHQRVQSVRVQHVFDILATMTLATLPATTWESISFVTRPGFLFRGRLRSSAASYLQECPSRDLSASSLSTPVMPSAYGILGQVHPTAKRVRVAHVANSQKSARGRFEAEKRHGEMMMVVMMMMIMY